MPPFVRHCVVHAHVLDVHGTLDVRTQVVEYRAAIRRIYESRLVNYGKPYTLPMKFGKKTFRPLKPFNLWIYGDLEALYPFNRWTLEPLKEKLSSLGL